MEKVVHAMACNGKQCNDFGQMHTNSMHSICAAHKGLKRSCGRRHIITPSPTELTALKNGMSALLQQQQNRITAQIASMPPQAPQPTGTAHVTDTTATYFSAAAYTLT